LAGVIYVGACAAVELPCVPGTDDPAIGNISLSQRAALMDAIAAQRVDAPPDIAEGIEFVAGTHLDDGVFREIGHFSDLHKGHIPIKPRLRTKRKNLRCVSEIEDRRDARMRNTLVFPMALAAALLLTGCGTVTIARINADPSRFQNRTVHVSGTVVTSVGILGTGGYQVDDGTGKIIVISRSGVPSGGSHVEVTGAVVGGAQVLGTSVGTAIREQHHKVKE
jgi:hypothetical protein